MCRPMRKGLEFKFVDNVDEALKYVFVKPLVKKASARSGRDKAKARKPAGKNGKKSRSFRK